MALGPHWQGNIPGATNPATKVGKLCYSAAGKRRDARGRRFLGAKKRSRQTACTAALSAFNPMCSGWPRYAAQGLLFVGFLLSLAFVGVFLGGATRTGPLFAASARFFKSARYVCQS